MKSVEDLLALAASFEPVPDVTGLFKPLKPIPVPRGEDSDEGSTGWPSRFPEPETLFYGEWSYVPCTTFARFGQVRLRENVFLLIEEGDGVGTQILAAYRGGKEEGKRVLLQVLLSSNGSAFGTGVLSSPPSHLSVAQNTGNDLVDLFVACFDAAEEQFGDVWPEVEDWGQARSSNMSLQDGLNISDLRTNFEPDDNQGDEDEPQLDKKGLLTAYLKNVAGVSL